MTGPQLDKPGAGLPFFESLFIRWYVGPIQSRRADNEKNLRMFALVGNRILKEADGVEAGKRDIKVLVPRMRGIEDSSRNWSINETLEHLLITGELIRGLVVDLTNGRTSNVEVKIENVKPRGKYTGGDARADFRKFCAETVEILGPLAIEDAGPTHRHPWMGRFNALQWTWLLSGHGGVHLAQLKEIKKRL